MDDEDAGVEYSWTSLEAPPEGSTEPLTGKFVRAPGRAKVVYPNGDTYEGGFNEAKQKHGRGVYTWSNEAGSNPWVPEGGFEGDKAPPVVRYEGYYAEGKKHGVGKLTLPNGETYHGQWERDRFHGVGTYYYANGDIYSGEWVRGVKQGEGVLQFAGDESQLVGMFEKGSFVSGKWVMKDGTSWSGAFKDGKPLGRGIFYFPNGMAQAGEYVHEGEPDGDEADLKLTWKGEAVVPANAAATDLLRAPITV